MKTLVALIEYGWECFKHMLRPLACRQIPIADIAKLHMPRFSVYWEGSPERPKLRIDYLDSVVERYVDIDQSHSNAEVNYIVKSQINAMMQDLAGHIVRTSRPIGCKHEPNGEIYMSYPLHPMNKCIMCGEFYR